jgi:hypothetical protein
MASRSQWFGALGRVVRHPVHDELVADERLRPVLSSVWNGVTPPFIRLCMPRKFRRARSGSDDGWANAVPRPARKARVSGWLAADTAGD